jgi:hypothetical protein
MDESGHPANRGGEETPRGQMGGQMKIRKLVSIALIATMLFFAPSMIPARAVTGPCGVPLLTGFLPTDTAFATPLIIPCPPAPPPVHVGAWFWAALACPASIILSGMVANFRDNRQLTTWEAWSCGLLYWIPQPVPPQNGPHHH